MKTFVYSVTAFLIALICSSGIGRNDVPLKSYYSFAADSTFNCIGEVFTTKKHSFGQSCVLISNRYILSSAHGFFAESDSLVQDSVTIMGKKYPAKRPAATWLDHPSAFYVKLGGKTLSIKRIIIHPGFDPSFGSLEYLDIAILELTEPVNFITPAVLYSGSNELGARGIACGFGEVEQAKGRTGLFMTRKKMAGENMIDSLGGNMINGQLTQLFADMDHPDHALCNRMGSSTPLPLEWRADQGDCGSGLFIRHNNQWQLAGVSFGPMYFDDERLYWKNYGYYGFIDGWTRISPLVQWIDEHTR